MSLILQKISFSSQISMARKFKQAKAKLDFLTDIDMLLMVEKGISHYICHFNLCGWAMPQKLPGNNFEWIEDNSQFN